MIKKEMSLIHKYSTFFVTHSPEVKLDVIYHFGIYLPTKLLTENDRKM